MTEHEIRKVEVEAFVYSRETPTDEQLKKVQDFLEKKYNAAVAVIPKQDDSVRDGFRIEIGTSTYKWNLDRIFDWSAEGRAKQLKQSISEAIRGKQDVLPMIRQAIEDFEPVPKDEEVGTVLTVGDGIATISGLEDAEYGEILLFECGIKGMILDLKEDEIGCVIFGDESEITEGSMVRRTKKVAGIPVGEAFMGRVINALGEPVDGKGPITQEDYYPIENPAPGIIDRQPVNRPMETGGIDSPVAGYMMAKRGLIVDCIHYVSPPYTSERARMKVEALCEKLTDWCGNIVFYCVPFTELQEALRDNCPEELFTVLMRRLMVKIANRICAANDYGAIITGESVAQVASQTLPAIFCTNAAAEYPVFRPVIGMDKREIVDVARHIDTFEVSTLPYEDCCTVFSPKHPKTRPSLEEILAAEASFDFEPLIEKAVRETEVKQFKYGVRNVDLDM